MAPFPCPVTAGAEEKSRLSSGVRPGTATARWRMFGNHPGKRAAESYPQFTPGAVIEVSEYQVGMNRASAIKTKVLPHLGLKRLDELTPAHLSELQQRLVRQGLKPSVIDGVTHSALRGICR